MAGWRWYDAATQLKHINRAGKTTLASKRIQKEDGHQALKAKATKDKILLAVVTLINESGYSSASSTAIAKQAGITWGAVQHHYGNKDEILLAVMDMARDVYIQSLKHPSLTTGTLAERVDRFINIVWTHYKSDLYFAFSEIVMATRGKNSKIPLSAVRMNSQLERHLQTMTEIFAGYAVPPARLNEALRFVHRFLAGFAMDRVFEADMPFEAIHIQRLKDELLAIIHPQ